MSRKFQDGLSAEQRAPFSRKSSNASILAAAGSGKTRTLVHLIATDLEAGIPAKDIIAFTFTEKAASELLSRIHSIVLRYMPHVAIDDLYIGTIHSWCLQFLSEQSAFYGFTTLDELHVDALVSRFYDPLGLEQTYGKVYPHAVKDFLKDIEIFYNENLSIELVPRAIQPPLQDFINLLRDNRILTFGDMIRYASQELNKSNGISHLKALYVDEYQDVNPAQVKLIQAMTRKAGKVVVVGDDLQCIYNWRGSDVTRILNFPNEFTDVNVFRLSTSYRSRPEIVSLGNAIADTIKIRDREKIMKPRRPDVELKCVHHLSVQSEDEQADAVLTIVQRFLDSGVPPNRIAILLRSVLSHGKPIVDRLAAYGIPVQCPVLSRGGEFIEGFLLPVIDWLRSEHNEPRNQIEAAEMEKHAEDLWNAVSLWIKGDGVEDRFWDGINDWIDILESGSNDAYDVRGRLYDFLDMCKLHLLPGDTNLMVGMGIASQIIRSVEEIHRRRIKGYKRRTAKGVLNEVYFALKRRHQDFGESVPIDIGIDGVLVSTVHQAKGLEWPIVIIPMLVKNRFPTRESSHGTNFPDDIADRYGTTLEDERRLFYVAVTRAKERLFLIDPVNRNSRKRSQFLSDLGSTRLSTITSVEDIETKTWQIDDSDLVTHDPPPIRIGLSDLLIYLECPYQYGLRRVAAIQPSVGDELGFGKGLHELIQRRFESSTAWDDQQLNEQVNEYVNLPYMSEVAEQQSKQAIRARIDGLEQLGIFDTEVKSEVSVEVLLDGGVVHGIIDLVQVNDDGTIHIRDWKANIHDDFVFRYERQLQFYTYALRQRGFKVVKADLVDVAATTKFRKITTHAVDISDIKVIELVEQLENALSDMASRNFPATPSSRVCSSCDMARICAHRVH